MWVTGALETRCSIQIIHGSQCKVCILLSYFVSEKTITKHDKLEGKISPFIRSTKLVMLSC